jgi:chemotaxis protein MotB
MRRKESLVITSTIRGLFAMGLLALAVGCSSGGGLKDENARLKQEVAGLRAENGELRGRPDASQLQAKQNEIAQLEQRLRELESQLRKPEPGGASEPGIDGIATSYDRRKGEMTVNLPSDILFASGSAQIKPSAQATLNKVVAALKRDYAGKRIRVEGHTDSDPIIRSRDKWIDNLDLSLNRAAAVTRYLAEKGVDSRNMSAVGYGEAKPKGSKPASRRVEIVVLVG